MYVDRDIRRPLCAENRHHQTLLRGSVEISQTTRIAFSLRPILAIEGARANLELNNADDARRQHDCVNSSAKSKKRRFQKQPPGVCFSSELSKGCSENSNLTL